MISSRYTKERNLKVSEGLKKAYREGRIVSPTLGKKRSPETIAKIIATKRIRFDAGATTWIKGKGHSKKTRKKISETRLRRKIRHTLETRKILSNNNKERFKDKNNHPMFGKNHSRKSIVLMRVNGRHWKGGISKTLYGYGWTERLREKIRNDFDRICVLNMKKENGNKLIVHHIDCDKSNHNPDNLIPLYRGIHTLIHADEEFWNGTVYLNREGVQS